MAKNRYKQVKKVFSISLGCRGWVFKSPHSDQGMIIRTTLSKWVMCSDLSFLLRIFYKNCKATRSVFAGRVAFGVKTRLRSKGQQGLSRCDYSGIEL